MQRVPFKNLLSWRQRANGTIFLHTTNKKLTLIQQNCTFSVLLLWPGRRAKNKKLKLKNKVTLAKLRRNGQWRALAKRTILIPKCSKPRRRRKWIGENFCLLFRKVLIKKQNKQKRRCKSAKAREDPEQRGGLLETLRKPDVLTLTMCEKGEGARKVSESRQYDERGEL